MAEYVNKEAAYDYGTLYDWYISSISEDAPPVWTDEHIDELLNDFLVIPKETPNADVRPERYGHWERTASMSLLDKHYVFYHCTACGRGVKSENEIEFEYCPFCGAKMDGKEGVQK